MFKPFDTIEIGFPKLNNEETELIRGTLLYCQKSIELIGLHDNVFINLKKIGEIHKNINFWSFLGHNVKINTTRLVLVEKIDVGLIKSYNDLPLDIG